MAEEEYIDIPFSGGVDEHAAVSTVAPPFTLNAVDLHTRREGSVGRRDSYPDVGGGAVPRPISLGSSDGGDMIATSADGEVWGIFPDASTKRLTDDDVGLPYDVSTRRVALSNASARSAGMAIIGDRAIYVWSSNHLDASNLIGGVFYSVVDTVTGETLVYSERLFAPSASVYLASEVAVVAMENSSVGTSDPNIFTVVYADTGVTPPSANISRDLFAAAISIDGVILHGPTQTNVAFPAVMWSINAHIAADALYLAWTDSDATAAGPQASVLGTGTLQMLTYDDTGAPAFISSIVALAGGAGGVTDGVAVFHNPDVNRVYVARGVTATNGVTWVSAHWYVDYIADTLLGGWTSPGVVYSATRPALNPARPEQDILPFSDNANVFLSDRFTNNTWRAGFCKVSADNDNLALVWQGVSPLFGTDTSVGFHGVRFSTIDSAAAIVSAGTALNPNVGMLGKPWFDGESAHVLLSATPPVIFGSSPTRPFPTVGEPEGLAGRSVQSATFVGGLTDPDLPMVQEAVTLVDQSISLREIDVYPTHSQPCLDSDGNVRGTVLARSPTPSEPFIPLTIASEIILNFVDPEIPVTSSDDTLTVGTGSMSYYDGSNLRPTTVIPIRPIAYVTSISSPSPTSGADLFIHAWHANDFAANVHRSSEAVVTGTSYVADPNATDEEVDELAIPLPPFSLHKTAQRSTPLVSVVKSVTGDTPGVPAFNGEQPITSAVSPFYMEWLTLGKAAEQDITLFTTGELQPEVTNSAAAIATRRNRVFFVDASDRHIIRYSKIIANTTTVEYNNNLLVRIPDGGEGATALGIMDDKVIVFTADNIFYFSGEGPDNLGNGRFTDPRPIASSHGCINPKSIVNTHMGVFFQSRRGLMLLDRSLSVVFVGKGIRATLQNYHIVSGVEDSVEAEVRWTAYETLTGNGTYQFVLNMDTLGWSFSQGLANDSGTTTRAPVDSTFYNGLEYILLDDGNVIAQDSLNKSLGWPQSVTTAWIGPAAQSFERVKEIYLLGQVQGTAAIPGGEGFDIQVAVRYDYDNGVGPGAGTVSPDYYRVAWDDITIGGGVGLDVHNFSVRIPLTVQKCSVFKITVAIRPPELPDVMTPRDILISNIGVTVSSKGTGNKRANTPSLKT